MNLTNKKIGYVVFGDNNLNYGINYILWKNNITAIPAGIKTAKYFDVLLVSIFWWQHVYDWYKFFYRAGLSIENKKPLIIIGGQNVSCNPILFDGTAHVIVCGDGENILMDAIDGKDNSSFYHKDKKQIIMNHADISNNSFCYESESKIGRIEVMRGCPYHCKFCQISVIKKLREVNLDSVEFAIKKTKQKRVVLFAPNRTSHSQWEKIGLMAEKYGKKDLCPDVRYNHIDRYVGKTPQIGIEGISERLRFNVGKKLTNAEYKKLIEKLIERKINVLNTGYILDLPGENDNDFDDFKNTLDFFNEIKGIENFNLFFIFNMFMPAPYTELEKEKINIGRNYSDKIKKVLHDRKFKICLKGRLFSDYSRVLSLIATIGDETDIPIINEIANNIQFRNTKLNNLQALEFLLRRYGKTINHYTENKTNFTRRVNAKKESDSKKEI
jgi:radical SAM superfamily enzyme YgiQ (UPF0313 family)